MPKANSRGWWRDYFADHPGLRLKLPEAYTGTGQSAKDKVYCTKCLARDVTDVKQEDQVEIETGKRSNVRESAVIETHCQ
jgi:hypothetical protein